MLLQFCNDATELFVQSLTWSLFSDDSIDSIGKLQEKLAFMRSELKDERKKRIKSAIPVL